MTGRGACGSLQPLLDAIAQTDMPGDAQRVFHGRGGHFPGCEHLALDAYPPVWLLTAFAPISDAELAQVHDALASRWAALSEEPLNWVFQRRDGHRTETRLMAGSVPEPHLVQEAGARYRVHLLQGQNHGLFLDMAAGRQWVREQAAGQTVLNLFAYTCAFSVAALQGGARQVVNVDMSAAAIGLGQHNHAINQLQAGASFLAHDVFKTWGKITRSGPYHLVIVDPPSFQKGSFVATQDYAKLMRRLPELLRPGGRAMVCLNAPELDTAFLQAQMQRAAPELVFEQRLPNPPAFSDTAPERSLKVLIYRAPELPPKGAAP